MVVSPVMMLVFMWSLHVVIFLQSLISIISSSNSTRSSATNCRFSPILGTSCILQLQPVSSQIQPDHLQLTVDSPILGISCSLQLQPIISRIQPDHLQLTTSATDCSLPSGWNWHNMGIFPSKNYCSRTMARRIWKTTEVGDMIDRIEPSAIFGTQMERHIGKRPDIPCGENSLI